MPAKMTSTAQRSKRVQPAAAGARRSGNPFLSAMPTRRIVNRETGQNLDPVESNRRHTLHLLWGRFGTWRFCQ